MLSYFSLIFLQLSWAGVSVFDESPISCDLKNKEQTCSIVLCGDKQAGWAGFIILPSRGKPGDVNEFLKNVSKYDRKIKKTNLKDLFGKDKNPENLSGHLEFNKIKSKWLGHLEAQFDAYSDKIDFKSFELKDVHSAAFQSK